MLLWIPAAWQGHGRRVIRGGLEWFADFLAQGEAVRQNYFDPVAAEIAGGTAEVVSPDSGQRGFPPETILPLRRQRQSGSAIRQRFEIIYSSRYTAFYCILQIEACSYQLDSAHADLVVSRSHHGNLVGSLTVYFPEVCRFYNFFKQLI